ncbi:MAG TPA: hypothetical protein PKK80_04060 [Bacilli bacterium]|nr:hypothetical protein [Bacilli bacterium]
MEDNKSIFRRAELAVSEAFEQICKLSPGIILNQEIRMNPEFPPAWVVSSEEFFAQSICTISTHRKNGYLLLRVWSPFYSTKQKDGKIIREQEFHDFIYNNEGWNDNAKDIAFLVWHYLQLLEDWHMTYANDFEGYDLDEEEFLLTKIRNI